MPPLSLLLIPCLAGQLLAAASLHGAGFPIRRADSSWGKFSAGFVDGDAFLAAGQAHGEAGKRIAFIGSWDLDGNPSWEKSTRDWADTYRSIRKNPDGTYLLLGDTYPLPDNPHRRTGTLFLVLDGEGNTVSRAYVTVPPAGSADSVFGDSTFHLSSTYLDFATLQGRHFLLGRMDRTEWPFLAEVDDRYRLLSIFHFPQEERNFVASRLLPWNGKLLVLGSSGDYWRDTPNRTSVTPTILVMGPDGGIERTIDTLDQSGWTSFLTDAMVVGDKLLLSGPRLLAQLDADLRIDWKRRMEPNADRNNPTLLRRDEHGNLLVFVHTQVVHPGHGQLIYAFDPTGNPLRTTSLLYAFAGYDFLPAPGGMLLALGLGTDNLPYNIDEAARIYRLDLAPLLIPSAGAMRRPGRVGQAEWPAYGFRDALGRRAGEPGGFVLLPMRKRLRHP